MHISRKIAHYSPRGGIIKAIISTKYKRVTRATARNRHRAHTHDTHPSPAAAAAWLAEKLQNWWCRRAARGLFIFEYPALRPASCDLAGIFRKDCASPRKSSSSNWTCTARALKVAKVSSRMRQLEIIELYQLSAFVRARNFRKVVAKPPGDSVRDRVCYTARESWVKIIYMKNIVENVTFVD